METIKQIQADNVSVPKDKAASASVEKVEKIVIVITQLTKKTIPTFQSDLVLGAIEMHKVPNASKP